MRGRRWRGAKGDAILRPAAKGAVTLVRTFALVGGRSDYDKDSKAWVVSDGEAVYGIK